MWSSCSSSAATPRGHARSQQSSRNASAPATALQHRCSRSATTLHTSAAPHICRGALLLSLKQLKQLQQLCNSPATSPPGRAHVKMSYRGDPLSSLPLVSKFFHLLRLCVCVCAGARGERGRAFFFSPTHSSAKTKNNAVVRTSNMQRFMRYVQHGRDSGGVCVRRHGCGRSR